MLSENEIVNRFQKHGMIRGGGELYLEVPIAFNFLEACQENNLASIGIEGFLYDEEQNTIEAKMDYIADYSVLDAPNWEAYRDLCNRLSKDFLRQLPSRADLVVNFVAVSREEWEQWEGPIEIFVSPSPRKVVNL